MADHPHGREIDLRAAFSYQLPTRLICDLFGVPAEQRPAALDVVDAILDTAASSEKSARTRRDMDTVMRRITAAKRADPGDDMTSTLLAVHDENGDHLSEYELISTLVLLIGAGSETAKSLINHAVVELLSAPDVLGRVQGEDLWDMAIEEALRLHPPIMHMPMRWATADIELSNDVVIPAGEPIFVAFGAHGRDPDVHFDPATFAIDRADKDHMAFGYGVHYCLGAPLGKLEARIALPALFNAFPRLRLAQHPAELPREHSLITNDYLTLPVYLD